MTMIQAPRGHPKNKIHWERKRKERKRKARDHLHLWIAINQETCLFCAESFWLQNTKTQWRTIATSQENTTGCARWMQLPTQIECKPVQIPVEFHEMGSSFFTTFSFIPLAFRIFLVSFPRRTNTFCVNHSFLALIFHLTQSLFLCVSLSVKLVVLWIVGCVIQWNSYLPPYLCKFLPSRYLREGCRFLCKWARNSTRTWLSSDYRKSHTSGSCCSFKKHSWHRMNIPRSEGHEIYSMCVNKVSLSLFDIYKTLDSGW